MVDTLNDLRSGAEIVAEQHFPSLPRLRTIGADVGSVLFKKNTRVSQTELIDRLFYVANQKTVLPL